MQYNILTLTAFEFTLFRSSYPPLLSISARSLTKTLADVRAGRNASVASQLLFNPEVVGISQDPAAQPAVQMSTNAQPSGENTQSTVSYRRIISLALCI